MIDVVSLIISIEKGEVPDLSAAIAELEGHLTNGRELHVTREQYRRLWRLGGELGLSLSRPLQTLTEINVVIDR